MSKKKDTIVENVPPVTPTPEAAAPVVPAPPERPHLVIMDQADIQRLVKNQQLLNHSLESYNLMQEGVKFAAQEITKKYGLPEEYELDISTGKVYAKGN